jgi:hypothetical protein
MAINVQTSKHLLRVHGMILILGLLVQYMLGMFSNLYVQFPDTTVPGKLWEFAWTQVPVATHIVLGMLLFLGALALLIRALLFKKPHLDQRGRYRAGLYPGGRLRRRQLHSHSK